MTQTQTPVVRFHRFFAQENERTVILRQGPAKQFRPILLHRDTDRFEDGQWVKHAVTPECCDLSPDADCPTGSRDASGHCARGMTLIRDFTDMKFDPVRAPYDWRDYDPDDSRAPEWHPLQGEEG